MTGTIKRVRCVKPGPEPIRESVMPRVKTLKKEFDPKMVLVPENRSRKEKAVYYRRMAVDVYSMTYHHFHRRPGLNYFVIKQITADSPKDNKYKRHARTFDKVVNFLLNLREEYKAVNKMRDLLKDYFTVVIKRQVKFGRNPNVNSIGAGPANTELFIDFAYEEENDGYGYWLEQKHLDSVKYRRDNPWLIEHRFDDPIIDLGLLKSGLKPIYRPYRKLSPNREIMEHGVEKIYSPIGELLEERQI